nr:restriction endonuclease subunit S [uncultured Prevotella sp.]
MEEWKEYRYTDLATIIGGGTPKTSVPEYWSGEIPWLSVKDFVSVTKYVYDTEKHISELGLLNSSTKLLEKNDIVISARGTVGAMAMIPDPMCFNQSCFGLRGNNIVDKNFLYYLTRTKVDELRKTAHGSVFDTITRETFDNLRCLVPPLQTQQKIGNILSSLDSKIELNKRINDNLEQQAQALFKSWFVDFEPFKDRKFVDSELGMIPEGWRVEELGNITNSITEKVGNRTDVKVLSPVNTGELLLSEEYFTKQVYSKNLAKYIMVAPNDFSYNPARINIGSIGMNTFDFRGCVSPVYVVFRCEKGYHHFFNIFKTTKNFKEEVNTRAIGGVRQTLSYKDFSLIKIVYPPKEVVEQFNKIYSHIMTLIKKNILENKRLHQTRDILLPKLMSGELKINDINN